MELAIKEGWCSGRMQSRSVLELWANEFLLQDPHLSQASVKLSMKKDSPLICAIHLNGLTGFIKSIVFCSQILFEIVRSNLP